ncbi:MAG TPA: hypothetical protein DGH68_01825 [Bacteroidetes bacterium]|nr:hypothetical protein [Bacteroidota bacterium]
MSKTAVARIVIVEDENITALDIRSRLQGLGYQVLATASSGGEALEKVAEFRPDLVLMDIVLKGSMDGVQAAGMIRSQHNIPVVYLTAFSDNDTLQRARVTEPFGYVLKPFEERDLHSTIEMALYKHRMEEKQRASEERYRMFSELASDYVYSASVKGDAIETEWVAGGFQRVTGFTLEEVRTRGGWLSVLHPDDAPGVLEGVQRALKDSGGEFEYRITTKTGETRWLHDYIRPVLDAQQRKVIGIVGGARDITERKRAEEALRETNAFSESLLRTMPLGIEIVDEQGRILFVSKAMRDLVGEDPVGRTCWTVYKDDKQQCHDCVLKRGITFDGVETIESCSVLGGRTFLISHVGMMYHGKKAMLEVFHDITHRQQAEKALRQSETQYRLLFLENPYPIWVYDRETLRFLAVNNAAVRHYGYSRDEFLSMTLNDLRPSQGADALLKKTLADETGVDDAGVWKHRKKDGSIAFVEATMRTTEFLGRDAAIVVVNDITSRRQSEEKISMFGHAIGSIGEALSITDLSNRILFVNDAFLKTYGYTEQEVVGKSISIVRPPNAPPPDLPTILARTLQGGWQGELINRRKDGTEFPISLSTSVVYDDKGRAIALVSVAQDVSQQKQLEHQVRQSQKMESMGTMVGGISHDFNNILNNILGFVYQLRKYSNDPEKIAKYVDTIEKSATRGADLANQLLSIVRKKKRDDELVNINTLVDEVIALMRETFPKNITLEKTLPSQPLTTLGNHGELYQAVLNLCLNARDAMPDGGILTLDVVESVVQGEVPHAVVSSSFAPGQKCMKIQVRDTGIGIAKPILDKIFDPFFTTKDRGKGTGLGLSVVYSIVKNHKGTIAVDTEEGRGSAFSVYLPIAEASKAERIDEEANVLPESSVGYILLVDDEAPMLELGKELLEDQGYKVMVARDGMEALQIYRERWKEIALVVLDLVMPKLDGGQTFLEMKKSNPAIKAFFCTGYSSDQVISSLLSEESLCALQKPFKPMEFMKMVKGVLST